MRSNKRGNIDYSHSDKSLKIVVPVRSKKIDMTAPHTLVACHDCDLVQRKRPLRFGERAFCLRCGASLYAKKRDSFEHTIILAVTSLILFTLANVFPFMTFELHGRVQESLLFTGVKEFFDRGMWTLGLLVFCASILFPALKILGMLYVLVPLEFNRRPWKAALVFRMVEHCQTWAMMDVYLLGVIVAVVKLADLAILVPGVAIYSFVALIIALAAADSALDPHEVWERMEKIQ
jgi:paraquat-inducible protein A